MRDPAISANPHPLGSETVDLEPHSGLGGAEHHLTTAIEIAALAPVLAMTATLAPILAMTATLVPTQEEVPHHVDRDQDPPVIPRTQD